MNWNRRFAIISTFPLAAIENRLIRHQLTRPQRKVEKTAKHGFDSSNSSVLFQSARTAREYERQSKPEMANILCHIVPVSKVEEAKVRDSFIASMSKMTGKLLEIFSITFFVF